MEDKVLRQWREKRRGQEHQKIPVGIGTGNRLKCVAEDNIERREREFREALVEDYKRGLEEPFVGRSMKCLKGLPYGLPVRLPRRCRTGTQSSLWELSSLFGVRRSTLRP